MTLFFFFHFSFFNSTVLFNCHIEYKAFSKIRLNTKREIWFHFVIHQSVTLPKAEVFECNPPKFEKEEDMSNLSILNKYEPSN